MDETSSSPWPAFLCVSFGIFMATLDGSIVYLALPSILADFRMPLATVEWVVNAYLIAITGTLLAFGRLADLLGHRALFVGGLAGFTLGSLLCSLAPGPWELVGARAVQGLGGSMLMACAPAIVTAVFRPGERGRGLGLMGTVVALGLTSGPPVGGLLLGAWGWRSIFLVNLPVGLVGVALSLRLLPRLRFGRRRESFDLLGALLFTAGCAAALWSMDLLGSAGWRAGRAWAAAGVGAACLGGFVAREARVAEPLLDLGLFRRRAFSAPVAAAVLAFLSGFVVVLLVPFALSHVKGLDPRHVGLVLAVTPVLMSVLAPWAGSLSDRLGYRRLTAAGLALRTVSLAAFLAAGPSSPLWVTVAALALLGVGNGLFNPPNTSSIMGSVPPERLGVAGGVAAVARNLGMALGTGLGGATFTAVYQAQGGASLAAYSPALEGAFAAGWRAAMGAGLAACILAQWVSAGRDPAPAASRAAGPP